jgi:hypothetical protein
VSRAARDQETKASPADPQSGDDLDTLAAAGLHVREADPEPPTGPLRDAMAAVGEQRARANEEAMLAVLDGYLNRFQGVVLARLKGPKARRGTKFWQGSQTEAPIEIKALDAGYVVPEKLTDELADSVRPVALRVARDSGADVAARLGLTPPDKRGDGMFAVDEQRLTDAVEAAVQRILGVAKRHAQDIREEITGAEASEAGLDAVLDRVEAAHRKGGSWVRMSGRTLANALANEAAIRQAEALGVTHMQWLSKRDTKVRATHRHADGQIRRIDDEFQVGSWFLRFPADPKDLPASWPEVAGCRCSLGFRMPSKDTKNTLRLLDKATDPGEASAAAQRLLRLAAAKAAAGEDGEPSPVALTLDEPVVAYRVLDALVDAMPGQWMAAGVALTLALAAPAAASAAAPVLAVAIPAGMQVVVSGGAVILPRDARLEVVAMTDASVQARAVA